MSTKVKTIYDSETVDELQAELQKLAKEKPTKVDRQKMIALLFEDIKEALKIHTYEVVAARLTEKGFEVSAGSLRQIISRRAKAQAEQADKAAAKAQAEQADKTVAEAQAAGKAKRTRKPKAVTSNDPVVGNTNPDAEPPLDSQVSHQSDTQVEETEEIKEPPVERSKKRGAIPTQPTTQQDNEEIDDLSRVGLDNAM